MVMQIPAVFKDKHVYACLLLVLIVPIIASILSGYLGMNLTEAFECWCRSENDPYDWGKRHNYMPYQYGSVFGGHNNGPATNVLTGSAQQPMMMAAQAAVPVITQVASTATPAPTQAAPAPALPTLNNQQLQWNKGGRVMDCNNGACSEGDKVQIWDSGAAAGQRWTSNADGSVTSGGQCLDVQNGGTDNGTIVRSWSCNQSPAQKWQFQNNKGTGKGTWQLMNPNSTRCLDVAGGTDANGTQLQLWDCNTTSSAWDLQ